MPRKGENIYKRKDGRWEGRYPKERISGEKTHYGYVYGKTYGEVKTKLNELKSFSYSPEKEIRPPCSYDLVLDLWLSAVQINVKESSYARYQYLVEKYIRPSLGKYSIDMIGSQLIEQYVTRLLYAGRIDNNGGLSPKSVADILTIVKATLEYAKYSGYDISCNLKKIAIKKDNKEMRVLSFDEQQQLTSYLLREVDLTKFGILLSLYTGIRLGEVCALRWEHLHIKEGYVEVRGTMQRIRNVGDFDHQKTKIMITTPKSKCSIRDIPLPQFLIDLARQLISNPEDFVLTGEKSKFIEPRTLQNRFKKYAKLCDIQSANYHCLRHTFATRCVEVGFEIKSLSEILGHANVNITLNRYVHSSFELKKENMQKLQAVVNQ